MELVSNVLQWVVAPVIAFVWLLHTKIQELVTKVAVLENRGEDRQRNHDKEIAEIKETTSKIFIKLDNIEGYLRK